MRIAPGFSRTKVSRLDEPAPGLVLSLRAYSRRTWAGSVLTLRCPYCGIRADETELAPGGVAHRRRVGPDGDDAAFEAYLFLRDNPKGVHFERWRHAYGCGKWFHAARCTETNEVFGTYPAQVEGPPQEVLDRIAERRPGWAP